MPTYQTAADVDVVIATETTAGTAAATGATAYPVRLIGSAGAELKRAIIRSMEKRDDAFQAMGRLGVKAVDATYDVEITPGGTNDVLIEALSRSAWTTANAIGFATMTTIAIGTNTLTAAGGDFVGSQGLRVGDIFTLSGTTVAGNNGTRNIITAIGSLTIVTTTGAFTTLAATATGTLTAARKLVSGTTPTRRSFSIEQYDESIDYSELFLGMRVVGLDLSFRPGQMAKLKYTLQGMNRTALATGTSPYFTAVSAVTTTVALVADDSTIRFNGAPIVKFTGLDLSFKISSKVEQTIGSTTPADVFDNDCEITGSVTSLREDFSNLTLFDAETEFEVSLVLRAPTGSPPDFFSVFLPRVKIQSLNAPVGGDDGAKIETLGLMIGPKVAATGYNGTPFMICTSGP